MRTEKLTDHQNEIDVTGASLVAFDLNGDTFHREALNNQGKGDQFEAMKAAGNLSSLDPIVKKVLRGNIARFELIVSTLQEEIDVIQSQLTNEPSAADIWRCNQRCDGGSDASGHHFVDGNTFLPSDECLQRRAAMMRTNSTASSI